MEEYQYPMFFEAKDLTDREKEKIRRHFQKKRDSGGGDCGSIEKVGGKTYRICFKEKEDQERVLTKGEHTVCFPHGELHLTVRATCSPQGTDESHATHLQEGKAKVLEKTFKLDIFLLYYLRDNPKAFKWVQKQLDLIGCNVHLDFDEEEAVVRGDMEKGPGGAVGAAEKWEQQVDRIFMGLTERYLCHHVFEPSRVRKVMQDRSFVSDDVRVYTESGYAVVVGEVEAVKEKTAMLEETVPIRRELPVMEKQFKLVEEVFNREMFVHCPEVKVIRGADGIVLEGPDVEVKAAAEKLDELIKKIKEKRVQLPKDLLTFITTSGAVSKYQARFQQTFRNPVSLDVGSDLVLSSLSPAGLEEAEAAVLRELSVADEPLQGAAAAPPDLSPVKEILIRAKNQANREEFRVDFSFTPAAGGGPVTKVQLVGFTEHVNRLRELLHDYQMNQASAQEVLNLSHPELVDCFDQLLEMIGMKQTNVTLRASHLPQPCVLVSGPRCHVQQTHRALMSALAGLTSDTLVLDGPGALRYFQGDGKVSRELVESSCQVLIREQQQAPSGNSKTAPIKSQKSSFRSTIRAPNTAAVNNTTLKIRLGSLEDEQVRVLVAPMISKELTSTKIGKGLLKKGGPEMQKNFELMAKKAASSPGSVMVVDAPSSLGCSKIFFIECRPWDGVRGRSVQALGNGLKSCLDLCVKQGWCSVALPVIGPGVALKYPLREAVQVLTDRIHQFGASASCGSVSTIHVVIKPDNPNSEECYHDVHSRLSLSMNQSGRAIFSSFTSDLADVTITVGGGAKVQIICGDITNETTDAVVNTTDFKGFQTSACKGILTVAGPQVETELKNANVSRGDVFKTRPGSFPCKAILHVSGERDADVVEQLVCRIMQLCESYGYESVAIPAICAGAGGLDPALVAQRVLRGVDTTASSGRLRTLTNIRLVLIKIHVFLAFKQRAMQMFPSADVSTGAAGVSPHPPPPVTNIDPSILCTTSSTQQSTFTIVGLCRKDVDKAIATLKSLYQAQCTTQSFREGDLAGLTQEDVSSLKQMMNHLGVQVEQVEQVQEDRAGRGVWTVRGLKDGVYQVMRMINKS
ncbi:uncharacterized protein PAE49_021870 [Odontesthes bonariensis]|uniref:uncharacterized protein LOC142368601 n=1 Tax=Odontesthes bonariensis TaxID=219752 RepID=UPI003F586F80